MQATFRIITPPATPAVDLELALRHARVDGDAERDLFVIYLDAAIEQVEKYLGRALITQTMQWTLARNSMNSAWPFLNNWNPTLPLDYDWALRCVSSGIIELPYSPVQSVVSVTAGQWEDEDVTLVEDVEYHVDTLQDPARLRLNPAFIWGHYKHLSITYTSGYGTTPAAIPKSITHAVMMLATNLFENRGDDGNGGMSRAVMNLLNSYRIFTHAA